jgi:hypothetical protein
MIDSQPTENYNSKPGHVRKGVVDSSFPALGQRPSCSLHRNKPQLLASKLKMMEERRMRSLIPSTSHTNTSFHHKERIRQNISNMKQYIAQIRNAETTRDEKRDYSDIRNDLLSLHRRQSVSQGALATSNVRVQPNLSDNSNLSNGYTNYKITQYPGNATTSENDVHFKMMRSKDGTFKLEDDPHRYAKDYISMAREYKQMESYRCNNLEIFQNVCMHCQTMVFKPNLNHDNNDKRKVESSRPVTRTNKLSKVFFPCEHLCVCDYCFSKDGPWQICPLCNQNIKVVFEHNGKEIDEYWKWASEIKPKLEPNFRKSFPRLSRIAIAEAMAKSIEGVYNTDSDVHADVDADQDGISLRGDIIFDDTVKSKACVIC